MSMMRRWSPVDSDTLFGLFMDQVEPGWDTMPNCNPEPPVIDSRNHFTKDHNADYSRLPPELLLHIAYYIGTPIEIRGTGGRLCFRPELSTFRLTCHAFARAGQLAMHSTMRESNLTLYLPGLYNSLDDVAKVFVGTGFGQLVSKVVITVQPELDFMRLEQVIKGFCDRWGSPPHYSSFTLYGARKAVLETHVKRCIAQARLVTELKTIEGQATFAALLQGLPQVKALGVQSIDFVGSELADEYFNGSFKPDVSSLSSHKRLTHCDVVPAILPHLHHFTDLALDTDGSIFDRTSSTNIIPRCLGSPADGLMNSAFRLKRISITLTREDAMLRCDTHRPFDLRGAIAFGTLLSFAINLEDLSLRCPVGAMEDFARSPRVRAYQGLGNASWLRYVLHDQHWPKLRSVEIAKFHCDPDTLLSCFDAHKPTLLDVQFRKCKVAYESELLVVITHMRERLELMSCSIGIVPNIRLTASPGLFFIFQSFAIPNLHYFNPRDPFKWRDDPGMDNDDSERETMAAKVLTHYILFIKPDWDAYIRAADLQQERQ